MKFLFDHNLPPAWARALKALSGNLVHVDDVLALRDRFPSATPDVDWLSALAKEGSWAVISADQFKKSDAEKVLIRREGLSVFVLDRGWMRFPQWDRTVQLVRWWPKIVEQSNLARVAVRVPWKHTSKFDSLRP